MLHVGFIPDGTRRWANRNSKPLEEAYHQMALAIARCIDYFFTHEASAVSVYLLSKDNLQRPQKELTSILDAELHLIRDLMPSLVKRHALDVVFAGSLDLLPKRVRDFVSSDMSSKKHGRKLYLCMAYDPFDELQECISNVSPIKANDILSRLWVPERVDLVIRTSGENRLSCFLPLQTAYSELIFLHEYINDISDDMLSLCLAEYEHRTRRFGR